MIHLADLEYRQFAKVLPTLLSSVFLCVSHPAVSQDLNQDSLSVSAPGANTNDSRQQLIRVMQFEALLGASLSAEVGLCLDESRGERPLNLGEDGKAISARELAQIRRIVETCTLAIARQPKDAGADQEASTRLVGALRLRLEGLRALAVKQAEMKSCAQDVEHLEALFSCFQHATGTTPSVDEKAQLASLFQARKTR